MGKINKEIITYKDLKELPVEVIYELKHRKAYDEKYDKDFRLMPILSIQHLPKRKSIGDVQEYTQLLIFLDEKEIEEGEQKLKELEQNPDIVEIDATYYLPRKNSK